jgi:hypothetical protein
VCVCVCVCVCVLVNTCVCVSLCGRVSSIIVLSGLAAYFPPAKAIKGRIR